MASEIPDEAAAAGTNLNQFSAVWIDMEYSAGDGGAAATATCRWCDKTLCAGGRNGTSHLHRHIKRCRARANERRRWQPTATSGDQELEEPFYFVDGLNIPQLFDELDANGLVHIDHAIDAHFWPNLPQAVNSSSRWFFQKTRERKRTESKKRCVPDGFISQDQLCTWEDVSFKEKKMLADSTIHGETGTTGGDNSCGNNK